nr:MAG TPA: hypothetical protein [Caudoviricetes sp.]
MWTPAPIRAGGPAERGKQNEQDYFYQSADGWPL